MNDAETMTVDQVGCARCGGDGHPALVFKKFWRPVVAGHYVFTYWAICPKTSEPILMQVSGPE